MSEFSDLMQEASEESAEIFDDPVATLGSDELRGVFNRQGQSLLMGEVGYETPIAATFVASADQFTIPPQINQTITIDEVIYRIINVAGPDPVDYTLTLSNVR